MSILPENPTGYLMAGRQVSPTWISGVLVVLAAVATLNMVLISWEIFESAFPGDASSDWLINYADGFVRRGLIGSLLLKISEGFQINPAYWAVALRLASMLALIVIMWKPVASVFGRLLLFPPFIPGVIVGDKDVFILLMLGLSMRGLASQGINSFVAVNVFSVVGILSHELYAVYALPALVYVKFAYSYQKGRRFLRVAMSSVFYFIPAWISFLAVVLYPGKELSAEVIHQSWKTIYLQTNPGSVFPPVGLTMSEIGWTLHSQLLEVGSLMLQDFGVFSIPQWLFSIQMIAVRWFFLNALLAFIAGQVGGSGFSWRYFLLLNAILFSQVLLTIPIFFVGYDFMRWINLWFSSSVIIFSFVNRERFLFPFIERDVVIFSRGSSMAVFLPWLLLLSGLLLLSESYVIGAIDIDYLLLKFSVFK